MTLYIFDMGGVVARNVDVLPEILRYLDITREQFLMFAGEDLERLFKPEGQAYGSGSATHRPGEVS